MAEPFPWLANNWSASDSLAASRQTRRPEVPRAFWFGLAARKFRLLFGGELGLCDGVAYFESCEAADGDVFSEPAGLGGNHVLDPMVARASAGNR